MPLPGAAAGRSGVRWLDTVAGFGVRWLDTAFPYRSNPLPSPSRDGTLATIEGWLARAATAALFLSMGPLLWGIWEGFRRPKGRTSRLDLGALQLPLYLSSGFGFLALCRALWRPLPLKLSPAARLFSAALGSLLYFSGLGLVLWGRFALGRMYYVSTALRAELFANHRLVTHGPFAYVRHPIYLGAMIAWGGGLLIYRTWTLVLMLLIIPELLVRARREERLLAAEFGERWEAYARQVPAWVPRRPHFARLWRPVVN